MASLTRNQQLRGQKQFLFGASINPLGASIVMGPVVSLLALHYGANDFSMGIIYATVYLTCLAALLPPLFLRRVDISSILAWAWILRGLVSGGFLVLPFLDTNQHKIQLLICILITFALLRAVGACVAPPVIKALNRSSELTRFTGTIWSRWYFGVLCSTVLSFIILQNMQIFPDAEYAYMSLLGIAFVFNVITGIAYGRLPKTGTVEGGGVLAMARAVQYIRRNRVNNDVMLVTMFQVILAVSAAYQLSHIQGPLQFGAAYVFALTLAGIVGAYLMAKLVSLLGDSISFRSLLLLTHVLLVICSLGWLFIDYFGAMQDIIASILYIAATTFLALSACVTAAMSTASLPQQQRIEVSTMYLLNTALSAGIGLVIVWLSGVICADYFTNPYAFAYIPWLIFSLCICLWAMLRKSEGGSKVLMELQQLKPSNIQSMYLVQRVDQEPSKPHRHRVRQIENALLHNTPASREKLMKLLVSSHVTDRLAALYHLYERPHAPAYPLVAKEAVDPYSPIRVEAVTALGLSDDPQYITTLESLLTDNDPRVCSGVMKSLLRMNALHAQTAVEYYAQTDNHRQRYDILIGLGENQQTDILRQLLVHDGKAGVDTRWLITISLQWADTFRKQPRLAAMLHLEEDRHGEGVEDLLRECASAWPDTWQAALDTWTDSSDPVAFMEKHSHLEQWPVRDGIDVLLQLLTHVWPTNTEDKSKTIGE